MSSSKHHFQRLQLHNLLFNLQEPLSSSEGEAAVHICRAIALLKDLRQTIRNAAEALPADIGGQLPADSGNQHADILTRAQELDRLAKESPFGSADWSAPVQELLQLVASMDVHKQVQTADADRAADFEFCYRELDSIIVEGNKYNEAVRRCLAAVHRKQGDVLVNTEAIRTLQSTKHVHSQLIDIYCRAMQPR